MSKIAQTKNYNKYILSDKNIFESVFDRVSGDHNGATIFVPHVCNNIDLFGAGFAAQVAEKFPSVKTDYHLLGKKFLQHNLGYCQVLKVYEQEKYKHKLYIANMIAQNGIIGPQNPRPINYLGLAKSMFSLSKFIDMNTGVINKTENIEIHCPKFGSGLAGGNWNFISDLIDDIWGKYKVYIYNYNKRK